MNKQGKSQNKMMVVILLFMIVLIGLSFTINVANTKDLQTSLQTRLGETSNLSATSCYQSDSSVNVSNSACNITLDVVYPAGDWRITESQCDYSSVIVGNGTTNLTEGTDYNVYVSGGILQMLDTANTQNDTFGDPAIVHSQYDFCDSGFLKDSGNRSLANLWTTLMILTLIVVSVKVIEGLWKDN